jgi:arylsulfatase A-like enzyme
VPPALVPNVFSELPQNFNDDLTTKPRVQTVYRDTYAKIMGAKPGKPEKYWLHYLDFYYYLTRKADEQMGRVLSELDRLGLADHTLVLFIADHGEMCGSHRLQAKGPFVYQENDNIPFVVRWPGVIPAGASTAAIAHNPDVFPTLVEALGLGAETSHLPGKSLVTLFGEPAAPSPHDQVILTMGDFLGGSENLNGRRGRNRGLIGAGLKNANANLHGVATQLRGIYDGRYKFARYFAPGAEDEFELYDLQEDPLELRNLASDPGRKKLREELSDHLDEAVAEEMNPERVVLLPGT